ncbi:MAG TPA: hypothetical protein VHG27_06895, partial [Xanthobacteraceae bacterium]|nr:hypothetical protein [Xanthobacteraceae bacterium]
MRLRTLSAVTALAGILVFGGWAVLGIAGWSADPGAPGTDDMSGAAPVVMKVSAGEPGDPRPSLHDLAPGIYGWDPALLSPRTT